MFCSSSSTSTTHLPGTDVNHNMHGDVETRALTGILDKRPSVNAEERSSTTRLRSGAATTSRVKGEERRTVAQENGLVRKTKKGG